MLNSLYQDLYVSLPSLPQVAQSALLQLAQAPLLDQQFRTELALDLLPLLALAREQLEEGPRLGGDPVPALDVDAENGRVLLPNVLGGCFIQYAFDMTTSLQECLLLFLDSKVTSLEVLVQVTETSRPEAPLFAAFGLDVFQQLLQGQIPDELGADLADRTDLKCFDAALTEGVAVLGIDDRPTHDIKTDSTLK